ncbi:MAG: topoisomerase C-terminal repeat-containing protein [[Eubacterium] siraeum]
MVKSSKVGSAPHRSGCSFIAGTICGKCITETIAAMLCANKRTRIINGFTSKAGKAFSAALVVKDGKID